MAKSYRIARQFFLVLFIFSLLSLHCQEGSSNEDDLSLFEKIELEELPPADEYYIDDSPLNQILKLFDEEDYERQKAYLEQKKRKIIKSAGGIAVSESSYAQTVIHDYIARYMTNFGKQNLYKILDDGEYYRLYIREELKKRGMPAALEYLPLVESEYKATAKSRSGAIGLWQFMENSMSPFLQKNEWFDERLDPWKSTNAALSKLQDNYRMFNDWLIAIAAYNCGAGAMRRILKNVPEKSFWYIAEQGLLRDETINYIPKLLALAEIAENGDEYKIPLPEVTASPRYADFDYLEVNNKVSLSRLAGELRLEAETLKKLNPALLLNTTPPKSNYFIRLPMGMKKSAEEALKEILTNK
ncbi:MAG: lytic transglycosylase domain-containing protein [Treponema sp.]|uniref:lytic transglycosylase domain-containing protein n=1 Tax=Treponema sp. TaxID=166 RepID=UPI0025F1B5B7|nr:lytic transglycosylase domain-containing protein [Treponema sp.]MBQ8680004.1 lytic transglycosylase domain-containing protein [Treponema sp.]